MRAPIYEEKVVDYILELATVTEVTVSKDALYADEDELRDALEWAWNTDGPLLIEVRVESGAPQEHWGGPRPARHREQAEVHWTRDCSRIASRSAVCCPRRLRAPERFALEQAADGCVSPTSAIALQRLLSLHFLCWEDFRRP